MKYPFQRTAKRTFKFEPTFVSCTMWFKRLFQTQRFEKKDTGRCYKVLTAQAQLEITETKNADI